MGVITVVTVLDTSTTDPPGNVDEDEMTDNEVVGGRVDVVNSEEVELDVSLVGWDVPLATQLVEKRVTVGVVTTTCTVTCTGISVVIGCALKTPHISQRPQLL